MVTVDDDQIYSDDMVSTLFVEYLKFGQNNVYCHRAHLMRFNDSGVPMNYLDWKIQHYQDEPSFDLFATGVGGVLYPPNCMLITTSDLDEILGYSFSNDDIFLKKRENKMRLRVKVIRSGGGRKSTSDSESEDSLWLSHNRRDNDKNIKLSGIRRVS